jgi:NAD-dependent SIR2 family protein deacetylase
MIGITTYRDAETSLWNNFVSLPFFHYYNPAQVIGDLSRIPRGTPHRRLSNKIQLVCGSSITVVDQSNKISILQLWSELQQLLLHRYLLAKPNPAHYALGILAHPPVLERIAPHSSKPIHITQNIDALALRVLESLPCTQEEKATSHPVESLIEMHGDIFVTRCTSCQHLRRSYEPQLASALANLEISEPNPDANLPEVTVNQLPKCGGDAWAGSNRYGRCGGLLRPEVVWFAEVPPKGGEIARKMSACDMLLVVGTSSIVRGYCLPLLKKLTCFRYYRFVRRRTMLLK